MSYRKEDRESAQKKFDDACRGAGLSSAEKNEFGTYCHNERLLEDYMEYSTLKGIAEKWRANSALNPYHPSRNSR